MAPVRGVSLCGATCVAVAMLVLVGIWIETSDQAGPARPLGPTDPVSTPDPTDLTSPMGRGPDRGVPPALPPRQAATSVEMTNDQLDVTFADGDLYIYTDDFLYLVDAGWYSELEQWYPLFKINNNDPEPLWDEPANTTNLVIHEPLHAIVTRDDYTLLRMKTTSGVADVNYTVYFEIIGNRATFKMTTVVNSATLDNYQASVLQYVDTGLRATATEYMVKWEAIGPFEDVIQMHESSDILLDHENFVFTSPVYSSAHECDTYDKVSAAVWNDAFTNRSTRYSITGGDYAMGMKWSNASLDKGTNWVVPVIFGIDTNRNGLLSDVNLLRSRAINDFAVLDVHYFETNDHKNAVEVQVMNFGTNVSNRQLELSVNGGLERTTPIALAPGEMKNYTIEGFDLTPLVTNEVTVKLDVYPHDESDNNQASTSVYYYPLGDLVYQVQGYANVTVPNVEVNLYSLPGMELVGTQTTDANGNATATDLDPGDYLVQSYVKWYGRTVPLDPLEVTMTGADAYIVQYTNLSAVEIQVRDYDDVPIRGVDVKFETNGTGTWIATRRTDTDGNVTFNYFDYGYNLSTSYAALGNRLNLTRVADFNLTLHSHYTIDVNLSRVEMRLNTTNEPEEAIPGAKVHFYNGTSTSDEYLGFLVSQSSGPGRGNVSFVYASETNYTIKVEFFGTDRQLEVPPDYAGLVWSYTFLNLSHANYTTIKVNTGDLAEFETELIFLDDSVTTVTWSQNFTLSVLMNVTKNGGDETGPKWANTTQVEFKNNTGQTVFTSPMVLNGSEMGHHYLILNTSEVSGLLGGTPAIYDIVISAAIDGFSPPDPLEKTLYVNNVPTTLELSNSKLGVYWADTRTVRVYFEDALHEVPITGATARYRWDEENDGAYVAMTPEGNGWYNFTLDSGLGGIASYLVEIELDLTNYTAKTRSLLMVVSTVPTLINESSVGYNFEDAAYYSEERVYYLSYFDAPRATGVTGATGTFNWEHQESDAAGSGSLTERADIAPGLYQLNLTAAIQAVGSYDIWIDLARENYESRNAFLRFTINDIPTTLATRVNGVPVAITATLGYNFVDAIYWGQERTYNFTLADTWGQPVPAATANYTWSKKTTNLTGSGLLAERGDFGPGVYELNFSGAVNATGVYEIAVSFQRANYESRSAIFEFTILEIPTALTLTRAGVASPVNQTNTGYDFEETVAYGQGTSYLFRFTDLWQSPVPGASATVMWVNRATNATTTGTLVARADLGPGVFELPVHAHASAVGRYDFTVTLAKPNYHAKVATFGYEITRIPTTFQLLVDRGPAAGATNLTSGAVLELQEGERFKLHLNFSDARTGHAITDVQVSYALVQGGVDYTHLLANSSSRPDYLNLTGDLPRGVYTFTLTLTKPNYDPQSVTVTINVDWRELWGLDVLWWYVIVGMVAVVLGALFGYRYLRWARLPDTIKKIVQTRKKIQKGDEGMEVRVVPDFMEQATKVFGKKWQQLGLKTPFVPVNPLIERFTREFNNSTQKSLLPSEGQSYINDISIFSEQQMREQLRDDGVPGDKIPALLQIIKKFMGTLGGR